MLVAGGKPMRCRVVAARPAGREVVVTLAPGVTRDSVGRLKGAAVVLRPEERTPRPGGIPHGSELVGMRVVDEHQRPLGTVSSVYETGAHDALAIEGPGGETTIVPAITEVVRAIDMDRATIVVGDITLYSR